MSPGLDERRQGPDRRRAVRGGRRPADSPGLSPLILVADDNPDSSSRCEAILAKLHFAVAPVRSVAEAIRVMQALRPDVVVAHLKEDATLRRLMASDPKIAGVPVLVVTETTADPEALVEELRRVLRSLPPSDDGE